MSFGDLLFDLVHICIGVVPDQLVCVAGHHVGTIEYVNTYFFDGMILHNLGSISARRKLCRHLWPSQSIEPLKWDRDSPEAGTLSSLKLGYGVRYLVSGYTDPGQIGGDLVSRHSARR